MFVSPGKGNRIAFGRWGIGVVLCVIFTLVLGFGTQGAILEVRPAGDSGALLKAFADAQNGDEIVIPRGIYRLQPAYPSGFTNAPIQLINKTNITVRGRQGVEIVGDGPGELVVLSHCSSVRFEKITFRSNRAPVQGDWLYSTIMLYWQNEKLTFEDCSFLDFGNHAISQLWGIKESTDVVIRNCFFADGGDRVRGDGAAVSGIGSRWLIESNRVERCLFGFEIEGQWGTNQNITIRQNTIVNPRGCGIVVFSTSGRSADFSDIEISDNVIKDAVRDSAQAAHPGGILVGGGERVRVLRNTIERCDYFGILAHAQWSDLRDSLFEGNTVIGAGFSGIQVYQFLNYNASNIVVRSNSIVTAKQSGIRVAGIGITVVGNSILNSGHGGVFPGIEVENALRDGVSTEVIQTSDVVIDRNIIRNEGTRNQDYGIRVGDGVLNTLICPNTFRDLGSEAIMDAGRGTVVEMRITSATTPRWEVGSTVKVFSRPRTPGHLQTSDNLRVWTSVYPFETDANGEASIIVTPDMILGNGYRYYRAMQGP